MSRRYHYVIWRWWDAIDVDKLSEQLSKKYYVKALPDYGYDLELTYLKDARDKYLVKSDTLVVYLSRFRAVLTQKTRAPFTSRDVELRKILIELYPYNRSTFLPMQVGSEPEFETVEDEDQSKPMRESTS